jgi:uncharacterized iron-regulated membrane protein
VRAALVLLHRYVGLALAGFLILSGLTGSVIAFNHELDAWLNPGLFRAAGEGRALPPLELAARVVERDPRLQITYLPLRTEPGHTADIFVGSRIDPAIGTAFALDHDEVFVDPATGEVLGRRLWGCCLARENLLPFLYVLHMNLHAPVLWGPWLMGGVALAWMVDCFVGLSLTFPRGRPFLARWTSAWKIKTGGNAYRLNLDLHRAGGLWLWGLLLILAVSGVSLNLGEEVFEPAVSAISPITPTPFDLRQPAPLDRPIAPVLSLAEVLARATVEAAHRGWSLDPYAIYYAAEYGIFGVSFGAEHAPGLGSPWLYVDGVDGRLVGDWVPGQGTVGDIFHQLQFPLHSGQIAGLPTRILVSAAGLAAAAFSVTGVVIWWKKRAGRKAHGRRRPAAHAA